MMQVERYQREHRSAHPKIRMQRIAFSGLRIILFSRYNRTLTYVPNAVMGDINKEAVMFELTGAI